MITIDDVNKFLDEFKVKAKAFGMIFRDDRKKNTEALFSLGISGRVREKIVFSLESEDYSQGPILDTLYEGYDMWVFGKDYNGTELYIKITIMSGNALCISFHEAEHPIIYPFKKEVT